MHDACARVHGSWGSWWFGGLGRALERIVRALECTSVFEGRFGILCGFEFWGLNSDPYTVWCLSSTFSFISLPSLTFGTLEREGFVKI